MKTEHTEATSAHDTRTLEERLQWVADWSEPGTDLADAGLIREALDRIRQQDAEIARIKAEGGMQWRPIDTAPKNPAGSFHGPTILVYYTADELPWPAYWAQGKSGEGVWFTPDGGDSEMDGKCVTHWMPLPPRRPDRATRDGEPAGLA